MLKGELLEMVWLRIEKQVSEVRKKWKANLWKLNMGKNGKLSFFQNLSARPTWGKNFSEYSQKMHK